MISFTRKWIRFVSLICLVAVFSCSDDESEPEELAEETCSCLHKEGLQGLMSGKMPFQSDSMETLPPCLKECSAKLSKVLKSREKEERMEFTREFIKALADTKCATLALQFLPYDDMVEQLDEASR